MSGDGLVPAVTDKQNLRRIFRLRRREAQDVSSAIQKTALALIDSSPGLIGLYSALPGEVDLFSLREQIAAPVALPRADGEGRLEYLRCSDTTLVPDGCGIPAPSKGIPLKPEQISLLLVPALSVDAHGIRLGYGGGYYDRLRADPDWADVPAWAVLPSICLSSTPLPRGQWDVPFHGWITEFGPGLASPMSAS